jgi:ABC-2 type transport system ATP-binding protein
MKATTGGPPIVVDRLVKRFNGVTAVDDISFTVAEGTITALLGGNGAGKTTTLSILLGLVTASSGHITVLGQDMSRRPQAALAQMNFSSPYVDLPRRLSVAENLQVYGRLYGVSGLGTRIRELARELDFAAFLDRPTGLLSAGQRTRVTLAKALLNNPRLLLLDEPTASLDPDTGDWIRGYLEAWRARFGSTVLLASHNMAEVERLCDEAMIMRAGRIVDHGSPDDLISRYGRRTMEEVFLDIARANATDAAGTAAREPT